jgi:hypothetical protein
MPPASSDPTLDRELFRVDVEIVLGEDTAAVLHGWADDRGIPAERWHTQPDLWTAATTQAALLIFAEARARGESVGAADAEAAVRVGLEPEAWTKRRRKFAPRAFRTRQKSREQCSSEETAAGDNDAGEGSTTRTRGAA